MKIEFIFEELRKEYNLYLDACEGKPDYEVQMIIDDARRELPSIISDEYAGEILDNYRTIMGGRILMDKHTVKQMIVSMFFERFESK